MRLGLPLMPLARLDAVQQKPSMLLACAQLPAMDPHACEPDARLRNMQYGYAFDPIGMLMCLCAVAMPAALPPVWPWGTGCRTAHDLC